MITSSPWPSPAARPLKRQAFRTTMSRRKWSRASNIGSSRL